MAFRPYRKMLQVVHEVPISENGNQTSTQESKNEDDDDDDDDDQNPKPKVLKIDLNSLPYPDINLNRPPSPPSPQVMPVTVVPNVVGNNINGSRRNSNYKGGIRPCRVRWSKEMDDNFNNIIMNSTNNRNTVSLSAGFYGGGQREILRGPFSVAVVPAAPNVLPPVLGLLTPPQINNVPGHVGLRRTELDRPSLQRKCLFCQKTETPLWRNGPDGVKSLCNACGIRFRKANEGVSREAAYKKPKF